MSNAEIEAHSTAAEVLEELSADEERERHRLELRVERAFFLAGAALRQLRDHRLYRDTHPDDFIGYCRDRFGKTKQAVNYLIAAAGVYENLATTIGCREDETRATTESTPILPTSERQVRSLAGLEPEKQQEIWLQAVDEADGKAPSGRIVRGIVERLKEKPLFKATEFCQVGDVFTLIRLEGSERKYNTCWAIASAVKDFSVVVDCHDGTLTVKPENLQPIDEPDARRQLPQILKRIRRLRDVGLLDRAAYNVLEDLGRQTYLTPLEEKFLRLMEHEYGIND